MLMDPHLSQQVSNIPTGLHPWQEVTRPNARNKPTLPEKSEVDGGESKQMPTQMLYD